MIKYFLLISLFITNISTAGEIIWESPVVIDPPNPQVGDRVRVGLFEKYYPPCLDIPQENSIGETHNLASDGNNITLKVLATTGPLCNPIPFNPAPRVFYDLGVLGEGEYIINTNYIQTSGFTQDQIPPFPLPDYFFSEAFGEPVSFTVRGLPQQVSTLSWKNILLLILLMMVSSLMVFNYKKNTMR